VTPWPTKCSAASSAISPAPTSNTFFPARSPKYLSGKFNRGIADGNSAGPYAGFGTDPLGHGKGFMQKLIENKPGAPFFDSMPVCLFQLTQNLTFPHDHGVKAGGYLEQVANGIFIDMLDKCAGANLQWHTESANNRSRTRALACSTSLQVKRISTRLHVERR
jgi:hypothetical protein